MVAIVGIDAEQAADLAAANGLAIAAYNAPRQIVASGPFAALEAGSAAAIAAGARALRLAVAGAFHSRAMQDAVQPYLAELVKADFRDPKIPVFSGFTGRPFMSPPTLELSFSLTKPVQWQKVLAALAELGVRRVVQAAPGEVLCGLVRQNQPTIDAIVAAECLSETAR
jgi:[acyl-carrier-protein] S-malonyltransferase